MITNDHGMIAVSSLFLKIRWSRFRHGFFVCDFKKACDFTKKRSCHLKKKLAISQKMIMNFRHHHQNKYAGNTKKQKYKYIYSHLFIYILAESDFRYTLINRPCCPCCPSCSLLLLAAAWCSWPLLAAPCCSLLFLAVPCCGLLLRAARCCSLLLLAVLWTAWTRCSSWLHSWPWVCNWVDGPPRRELAAQACYSSWSWVCDWVGAPPKELR